jgi:outer membrane protein W
MLNASWLLVTTMLVGGGVQSTEAARPAAVVNQVFRVGHVSFAPEEQGSSSSSSGGTAPHTFGFGAMAGAGALGTGLGLRGWFGNYIGVDMRLLLSRAQLVNQIGFGGGGFSIEAAPSLIVMLTKPNDARTVDIRPYIGAGVNYTRAGTNATTTGSPVKGSGTQVFGGFEAAIRAAGGFAISGEVLYNKRSQALVTAGVKSGVTGEFGFLFYVK